MHTTDAPKQRTLTRNTKTNSRENGLCAHRNALECTRFDLILTFMLLQGRQQVTMLSQLEVPPLHLGVT